MAGGRPKKVIDYKLVEQLGSIQCTQEEIASALDISVRTLQRDEEFCRIYKSAMNDGRKSLRRLQWDAAHNGNTTMLVWLGKQYLGQRDKRDIEQTVKDTTTLDNVLVQLDDTD